ncbi:hypothetical protein C5C31_12860 [Rathayibacter rathayi]|uniref:hypothetical protein n=2 Tax=Rathayibacter rathayi TaxID=33887 RepID=UPI000CE7D0EF|nr:hypothetical protein [Rathayibacter rathayi]PPG66708.1 hypothetical protein C5C02_10865 [Rathayibacter rathayi]PPG74569.1 hypothetical protein C5C23_12675 [Rathayibacter rathayi]PPH19707.1 hypothetical protein C5C31_12860 [Rathayibacter rathayi]PPI76199.1 hypothetical protein C5E03_11015 [Rathayibacter rathayi]
MNTTTPTEGRTALLAFVKDTSQQLDITGWWPKSGGAAPDSCGLGGGEKGASYSFNYWAPRGTDPAGDAQKVATYWETLGMDVRIADSTPWPTVYGEGGPVLRAAFDTHSSEDTYLVTAVARCAPGDAIALLKEDNAQRAAGIVVPGDEGTIPRWDPKKKYTLEPVAPATTPPKPKPEPDPDPDEPEQ